MRFSIVRAASRHARQRSSRPSDTEIKTYIFKVTALTEEHCFKDDFVFIIFCIIFCYCRGGGGGGRLKGYGLWQTRTRTEILI